MFSFLKKALGTETEEKPSSSANNAAKTDAKPSALLGGSDSKLQVSNTPTGLNVKEITTTHGLSATAEVVSPPSPDVEDVDVPESEILTSVSSGVASTLPAGGNAGAASKTGTVQNLAEVRHEVPAQRAKEEVNLTEDLEKMAISKVAVEKINAVDDKEKIAPVTVAVDSGAMKSVQTAVISAVQPSSTVPVLVTSTTHTPVKDGGSIDATSMPITDKRDGLLNEVNAEADDDDDETLDDSWKTVISPSKSLPVIEKSNKADLVIATDKKDSKDTSKTESGVNHSSVIMSKPITITEAVSAEKSESSSANTIPIKALKSANTINAENITAIQSASNHIDLTKVTDVAPTISKEASLLTNSAPASKKEASLLPESALASKKEASLLPESALASKKEASLLPESALASKKEASLLTESTTLRTGVQDVSPSLTSKDAENDKKEHRDDVKGASNFEESKKDVPLLAASTLASKKESSIDSSVTVSHSMAPITPSEQAEGSKIGGIATITQPLVTKDLSAVTKDTIANVEVEVEDIVEDKHKPAVTEDNVSDAKVEAVVEVEVKHQVQDQARALDNEDEAINIKKNTDINSDIKAINHETKIPLSETVIGNVQIIEIKSSSVIPEIKVKSEEMNAVPVALVSSEVIGAVQKVKEEEKEEKKTEVKEEKKVEVKVEKKTELPKEEKEKMTEVKKEKEEEKKEVIPLESKINAVTIDGKEIIIIDDSDDDKIGKTIKTADKVVYVIDDSDDDNVEPVATKTKAPPVVYTIDSDDDDDVNVQSSTRRPGSQPRHAATTTATGTGKTKTNAVAKNPSCPGLEAWETCINELDELEVLAREMQRDRDDDDDNDDDGNDDEQDVNGGNGGGDGNGGDDDGEDQWSDYNEELNGTADANDDYDMNEVEVEDDLPHTVSSNGQKDFNCDGDDDLEGVFLSDDEADETDQDRRDRGNSGYRKNEGSGSKFPSSPPGISTGNSKGTVYFNGRCF